jgi:hypothetical protein
MKEKRYKKIVEWEKEDFGFFSNWIVLIFLTFFFPIVYFWSRRNVHYVLERKVKPEEEKE